jgi:FAD synthase
MGNFDGVHLGHRAVISAALSMGRVHRGPRAFKNLQESAKIPQESVK